MPQTLTTQMRTLRAQEGLQARCHKLRQTDAPVTDPTQPLTLAVTSAGPPHSSVRHVQERIAAGLRRLGYEPRTCTNEAEADAGEAVIGWGPWGRGARTRAGALVRIDPVDSWRLDTDEIRRKNAVALLLGLSTESCRLQMQYGVKRIRPLPISHDPNLHSLRWRGHALPHSVMSSAVWHPAVPASQRWGSTHEYREAERFWFVHCSAMQPRKRVADLVRAYCQEFAPDDAVGLLIKTQLHNWGRDIGDQLREWLAPFGGLHAPVVYSTATVAEQSLSALYGAAGAYVSVAGMEGWDLPCLEAMACGALIVATDYSGHRDFLTDENAILIPCDTEPMGESDIYLDPEIAKGLPLGRPRPGKIREALRTAYNLREPTIPMVGAMERTCRWFTPELTAATVLRELELVGVKLAPPTPKLRTDEPRIALCIPVYNYRDHLERCLRGLEWAAGVRLQVLIQDDGSTDGTEAMIGDAQWSIPIEYERWPRNQGYPSARARLVERALATDAEFICWFDGDMLPPPGEWLLTLASVHVDGISGPRMRYPDGSVWWAGADLGPECSMKQREGDGGGVSVCDHVPGACQFMRLELFRQGLRIDTEYPRNTWEDLDLCSQVRFGLGEHCWYRPEVELVHNGWHYRKEHQGESESQRRANYCAGWERYRTKWAAVWSRTRDRVDSFTG